MSETIVGLNSVMEALQGKIKINKIFIENKKTGKRIESIISLAEKKGIFLKTIEKSQMDRLFPNGSHQGIVAEVESYTYAKMEDIFSLADSRGEDPFIVMLDGIEDPHNLGAIIRSAECAGVHGIILPKNRSAEVNATVYKTSAGAISHMLVVQETNLTNCIQELKAQGLWVLGADMGGVNIYTEKSLPTPAVIVIGNEGKGIRPLIRKNCDLIVSIPMFGVVNSLNASNAAALIIYEIVRRTRI